MIDAYRCGSWLELAGRLRAVPAGLLLPSRMPTRMSTPAHLFVTMQKLQTHVGCNKRGGSANRASHLLRLFLNLSLLSLLAFSATLQASEGFQSVRLDLVCVEQPMRAVAFGAPGKLSYGEQAPKESDPIDVLVTKNRPGEDFNYDFASIESSAGDLETAEAIWLTGKQIEAQQGRFKINLENLVMTLTETDPDGSARFRRFDCKERAAVESTSD